MDSEVQGEAVDAEGDADQLLVHDIEGVTGDVVTDLVGETEADGDCVGEAEAERLLLLDIDGVADGV